MTQTHDWSKVLDTAVDHFFLVDRDGKIVFLNRDFLGRSRESLLGGDIFELVRSKSYRLRSALEFAFDRRSSSGHEVVCHDEQGAAVPFTNKVSPVLEGESVVLALVVFGDSSERQAMERLIEAGRANAIHLAKMATLGEMAGGVAHEINNPLAVIQGMAHILTKYLAAETIDRTAANHAAEQIEEMVGRISKIVRSLGAFSGNASNDPAVATEIRTVLLDMAALCLERFKRSGTELILDLGDEPMTAHCRGTEVSQVLLNLLNNAAAAVQALGPESKKWVRVSARVSGEWVELSVADAGGGIPEPVREKLFQPFFTTKKIGEGMGLGLSVAKGLIENNGGTLELDAKAANTRFVVRLKRG